MNNNPNNRRGNSNIPNGQNRQPRQNQPYPNRNNQQIPRNYPQNRQNIPYSDTYDRFPPVKHRSRRAARKAAALVVLTAIIFAMLLISLLIFVTRCSMGAFGSDDATDTETTLAESTTEFVTTEPPVTEPQTTALNDNYEYKSLGLDDLHSGYQILVNYQNAFVFESSNFTIKTFYGNKNTSYKVRDTLVSFDKTALDKFNEMMLAFDTETGKHDILVNSSYRTQTEQEEIYQQRVDQYSEEYASLFVAMPGFSEHHTGLAVDLTIYTDKNESMTFTDNPDYTAWMASNAHKFGFILRYPSDKTDITKIGYEDWHYRYVGKPHAYYISVNNLCFEEYIDELRKYPFDGKHLEITDDEGKSWEIYFVAATGETTEVPVPKYIPYEISGNNVDGFIITIQK